jgi:hypothetical protein
VQKLARETTFYPIQASFTDISGIIFKITRFFNGIVLQSYRTAQQLWSNNLALKSQVLELRAELGKLRSRLANQPVVIEAVRCIFKDLHIGDDFPGVAQDLHLNSADKEKIYGKRLLLLGVTHFALQTYIHENPIPDSSDVTNLALPMTTKGELPSQRAMVLDRTYRSTPPRARSGKGARPIFYFHTPKTTLKYVVVGKRSLKF